MNRQEHLDWCKQRALEYCDKGDLQQAFASMVSDMGKHEGTRDHIALDTMPTMFFGGFLNTPEEMRTFIEGVN